MPYSGKGRRKVLLLGESPGLNEDKEGKQFVGMTGQLLQRVLAKIGVDMRKDCWLTNSCICHPPKNELPESAIDHCRPNLIKTIQELKPEVIIPLGATAVKSLVGWLWKEDVGSVNRWVGWQIPCQRDGSGKELNSWICPTWHPSHLSRQQKEKNYPILEMFFEEHLRKAFAKGGRPWEIVPDYKKEVKVVISADEAAMLVDRVRERGKPIAFDYEINTLKPDSRIAQIVCCSVSDGQETFAFPWHGRVRDAMGELLRSKVPKWGWNVKFEDRWTRKEFGYGVRNWQWDGMLATHVLDNRAGICSLKFQSFVLLGQESYDDHVKPFLRSKDSNSLNKIKQLDLKQLLVYNSLDSLLEYKIAKIQMRSMENEGDSQN